MEHTKAEKEVALSQQFLKRLRDETRPLHDALDSSVSARRLMSDDVQRKDYEDYLVRFAGIVGYYEATIFPLAAEVIDDIDERKKLHLLRSDMSEIDEQALPVFSGFTELTLPHVMGYMYVMEGSTLGGAVMYKHLHSHGVASETDGRFFLGYGADTGRRWKSFIETFTQYVIANDVADEVIAGAKIAFQRIREHMVKHQG